MKKKLMAIFLLSAFTPLAWVCGSPPAHPWRPLGLRPPSEGGRALEGARQGQVGRQTGDMGIKI